MSLAWETTVDDLKTVLDRHNVNLDDSIVQSIFDDLDFDQIEQDVLCYNSMDQQIESMYKSIESQLIESKILFKKEFKDDEDEEKYNCY